MTWFNEFPETVVKGYIGAGRRLMKDRIEKYYGIIRS